MLKKISACIGTLCVTALIGATAAFAQAPALAPAPAAPVAAPAAAKVAAPVTATRTAESKPADGSKAVAKPAKPFAAQTAKSKECSLKADEKKLHGKERQKFRADCKKAA
jgi:hypothetical protein